MAGDRQKSSGLTWRRGIRKSSQGITVVGYLQVWPVDEDMGHGGCWGGGGCSLGTAGFKCQSGEPHPLITKAS